VKGGFDEQYLKSPTWCGCVINIMLAEKTNGVSERLAIGFIHPEAWGKVNPALEYIQLG
jgi:hypothetical protein